MKLTGTLTLAFALLVVGASAAAAGSVTGSAALALAGVVAPHSSSLSAADKRAVAAFFAGKVGAGCKKKISVTADKIVCRTSNVDITARSCQLTFRKGMVSLSGRELFLPAGGLSKRLIRRPARRSAPIHQPREWVAA